MVPTKAKEGGHQSGKKDFDIHSAPASAGSDVASSTIFWFVDVACVSTLGTHY